MNDEEVEKKAVKVLADLNKHINKMSRILTDTRELQDELIKEAEAAHKVNRRFTGMIIGMSIGFCLFQIIKGFL